MKDERWKMEDGRWKMEDGRSSWEDWEPNLRENLVSETFKIAEFFVREEHVSIILEENLEM